MPLPALLVPLVSFILRDLVVNFFVLSGVVALVVFLVPFAAGYLASFVGVSSLTNAFGSVAPGVWWWLDMFRLDYGVPLVISAFVARFLIRRLPVIG
ncbi:MAG TPA: DUF2523 family protein [Accumulibacter sp.]|jgi:hypothetical protein|nr:DUF2523 family protein [Accumulibacter sp.]HQC80833.1 DUF2523 family protein [Accumulibacter sp.]